MGQDLTLMPRLLRVDCSTAGIRRRRCGKGFAYSDAEGRPISDPELAERIRALVIPPAWRDVWICPHPWGHLQATGIDAAGRKQYLYHERWRERRDREKFEDMLAFARALPGMRRRVSRDLRGEALDRRRVLACAARLLDLGFFRIGSEDYAERNDSYGLATMRKAHVSIEGDEIVFDYPAKSGQHRIQAVIDDKARDVIAALKRRRGGGEELLAYREGRSWLDVRSTEINDYIKEVTHPSFSAKDFRTWNGTVLAARALAEVGRDAATKTARKRAMSAAVKEVSAYLGNTPAVCRASYIDPRVFDRYLSGWTIAGAVDELGGSDALNDAKTRDTLEAAVIDLIRDDTASEALEKVAA